MKRVVAQFRKPWRPGRRLLACLALLAAMALLAAAGVVLQQRRAGTLRAQVAQLADADRAGGLPVLPRAAPPYDASARQFLNERAAGWAPMLRTLESGAMIGVTPSAVEFNATDRVARVTLRYADSTALLDYLGRINEGVVSGEGQARWTLVETRMPSAAQQNAIPPAGNSSQAATEQSVATIRAVW